MQSERLRVLTYNIHKGVQGLGPLQRLEIYNVQQAIARLNLDVVCLQEVRRINSQGMLRFTDWPRLAQADFLAPHGFSAVYVTNAYTRYGEHGNALLSRWPVVQQGHQDISDHRYEQRGLLHSVIDFQGVQVHVIVVHLGLIAGSRVRQIQKLKAFIQDKVPKQAPLLVAGDFNDWNARLVPLMAQMDLHTEISAKTFPARWPLLQLDHIYARGMRRVRQSVPPALSGSLPWPRLSDHLPLLAEFVLE